MHMTVADVIAKAKWFAREHAAELDPFSAADWLACVVAARARLWALHPQAFHAGAVRVASLPAAPTSTDDTVSLADGWDTILAAAAAAHAVRVLRPADEAAAAEQGATLEQLEAAVTAGLGAL